MTKRSSHVRASAFACLVAGILGWAACGALEPIAEERCGNLVIEAGEDCDTTADLPGSERCVPLGQPGQCRYSCALRDDEMTRYTCPRGWGCGQDDVCRRHSGALAGRETTGQAVGRWFAIDDFDGDDELDIASISDASLSVGYLEGGVFRQAYRAPFEAVGSPSVADANEDGLADILSPSPRGLSLFRGTRARAMIPTAFASVSVQLEADFVFATVDLAPDLVALSDGSFVRFQGDEPIVFAGGFAFGLSGLLYPLDPDNPEHNAVGFRAEDFADRPVAARFDETADQYGAFTQSPEQIVIPMEDQVVLIRPAYFTAEFTGGGPEFVQIYLDATTEFLSGGLYAQFPIPTADHPPRTELTLPPGLTVDEVFVTHANRGGPGGATLIPCAADSFAASDEHLDLVLEAHDSQGAAKVLVAYGLGDGTFHSRACELDDIDGGATTANNIFGTYPLMVSCEERALAIDDIDGDGALDFVSPTRLHLSRLLPTGSEAVTLCSETTQFVYRDLAVLSEALTADFDGDGIADVMAANTEEGIEFMSTGGTATVRFATSVTVGAPFDLRTADFDGDDVADLAFREQQGDQVAANVVFGERAGVPGIVQTLATDENLLALEVANTPGREQGTDKPDDLLIAARRAADGDGRFRFAVLEGRADRVLQAPFVYTTEIDDVGQSESFFPYGAAIAPFDITCPNEDETDDNAQVVVLTGSTLVPGATPNNIIGSACVDGGARFTVGEAAATSLELVDPELVRGTAVIPVDIAPSDQEPVFLPAVARFNPVPALRHVELMFPVSAPTPEGVSWTLTEPVIISNATVAGSPASIEDASSPIRRWSPFLSNPVASCRFQLDQPPALVFMTVNDDGACPADTPGIDETALTVLNVVPGSTITDVQTGDGSQMLSLRSTGTETILGYACLNADADLEQELVIVTLIGEIEQCTPSGAPLALPAVLRVVELNEAGELEISAEPIGEIAAAEIAGDASMPPVSGLSAGDFNRDGVDDLFIATPDDGIIWFGRPVNQ